MTSKSDSTVKTNDTANAHKEMDPKQDQVEHLTDNEITAIVGWPTEPEMVKYRAIAKAATEKNMAQLFSKNIGILGANAKRE